MGLWFCNGRLTLPNKKPHLVGAHPNMHVFIHIGVFTSVDIE